MSEPTFLDKWTRIIKGDAMTDSYLPSKNAPNVHGLTGSNDRTTPNAASDPICRKCATQEHGDHVPDECTCGDYPPAGGFPAEDFSHLAGLLRNANESDLRAFLSNNLNTIIAALDVASQPEQPASQADEILARDFPFKYDPATGFFHANEADAPGIAYVPEREAQPEQPALAAVEPFAASFRISVNEDTRYKDVTIHLIEPHALSVRIPCSSDKSWIFQDFEKRRQSALTNPPPSPDVAALQSELGRWRYAALSEADEYERTLKRAISAEAAYSALLDANESEDRRAEAAEALVADMREALENAREWIDDERLHDPENAHPNDRDRFRDRLKEHPLILAKIDAALSRLDTSKTGKPS